MSTLTVSKEFQCSKEALYEAWTNPEQLKQWWKPMGKQLVDVENELREGGPVKYAFDGDSLAIDGTYKKVIDGELLEYSWNWHVSLEPVHDTEYMLTVRFSGEEQQSSISINQEGFTDEESIQPHRQGWEQGLEQLEHFLGNNREGNDGDMEVAGYHEDPEQVKVGEPAS